MFNVGRLFLTGRWSRNRTCRLIRHVYIVIFSRAGILMAAKEEVRLMGVVTHRHLTVLFNCVLVFQPPLNIIIFPILSFI